MPLQYSVAVRNARLNALRTAIGANPRLEIRTGPPPANCATADSGNLLSTIILPANWLADAAAGSAAKLGAWVDDEADASGTAAHFRIKTADGSACHIQGDITDQTGNGKMKLNNVVIAAGQQVTVSAFTLTGGNG